MAYVCDICAKGRDVGHNVSHAKNRTQRVRKPNLHVHRMATEMGKVKMLLCTKCKRLVKGK
ncbi:MAG: 50S ribosomal protein L28 [Microgenomates group bacterium GW2011_GWF2_47_9]|nr:MAG: 50S ribosomal protein L28 [Microgenomates group bacterium GW2011_GWF2_47_9]